MSLKIFDDCLSHHFISQLFSSICSSWLSVWLCSHRWILKSLPATGKWCRFRPAVTFCLYPLWGYFGLKEVMCGPFYTARLPDGASMTRYRNKGDSEQLESFIKSAWFTHTRSPGVTSTIHTAKRDVVMTVCSFKVFFSRQLGLSPLRSAQGL